MVVRRSGQENTVLGFKGLKYYFQLLKQITLFKHFSAAEPPRSVSLNRDINDGKVSFKLHPDSGFPTLQADVP